MPPLQCTCVMTILFALLAEGGAPAAAERADDLPPGYRPPTKEEGSMLGKTIKYEVPENMTTPDAYRFDMPFQQGPRCGPNGLYVLLRLKGIPVKYDDVMKSMTLTDRGIDIDTLQKTARSFGLDAEVRKLTPEELEHSPKPILVHLNTPASAPGRSREPTGHFTVVTKVDSGGYVQGIDTSNALFTSWSVDHYARGASGYCLVPVESARSWLVRPRGLFLTGTFVLLLVANLVLMARKQKREAHAPA